MKASKKRFRIGAQSDPVEFMSWLLNTLHADLKTSKKNMSIIYECFQVLFIHSNFFFLFFWLMYCSWLQLFTRVVFFLLHLLCLQGELEVVKEIPDKMIADKKENSGDQSNTEKLSDGGTERYASVKEASKMPFLMLGLDLPPPPLFKDVMEKNIIPQVLLHLMLLCLLHMKCCS